MALGNIQGGPFEDWVTNQIEQRELSLGKGSGKDPKDLLYQQSKTPWLRLASSVNITSTTSYGTLDRLTSLPGINKNAIEGIQAAKNFILQGGALSIDNNNNINLNSGLNTTRNLVGINDNFTGAYGWGGTTERGLVPMPGITSASVKYENDGALTKTTINIKCYSRTQFALIDALYMRPGYTLLLEFGWSNYLQTTNGDTLLTGDEVKLETTDPFFTPALSLLLNPENKTSKNQYKIIQKIKEERKRTSGNYEAVFGKIVNFKWSMDPDGSYNCTVDLRGLGEVIESLKLNVNTPTEESEKASHFGVFDVDGDGQVDDKDKEALKVYAELTGQSANDIRGLAMERQIPLVALGQSGGTLIRDLFTIHQTTTIATGAVIDGDVLYFDKVGEDKKKNYLIKNFPIVTNGGSFFKKDIVIEDGIIGLVRTNTNEYVYTPQVYVKFGLILALIQKSIVPRNGKGGAPLFTFDMDFQNLKKDKNLIRRLQGQFPLSPQHYLIPYANHSLNNLQRKYLTELKDLPTFFNGRRNEINDIQKNSGWKYNSGLGRLANVYVNVNRVATILLNQKGKINNIQKNEKDLFEFLNILLEEININLGGINNVRIRLPDDGARVRFIEDIPQTFPGAPPITYKSKICRFNTFGFNNSTAANSSQRGGSIVRNLGIDASIPSNFSSMIMLGAQPNGNQASGNATSFSNYNTGIIDRVIPTKSLVTTNTDPTDPRETQFKELAKTVDGLLESGFWNETWVGKGLSTDGGLWADVFRDRDFRGDNIVAFKSLGTAYHQLLSGIYTQEESKGGAGFLEAPFFLPFNLNMDIDGMSGIVMMQRFEIDQKILPPSYDKDSVEIIVKTVDHEVNVESWVTKLGTQSVPKIKLKRSTEGASVAGSGGNATSKGKTGAFAVNSNNPNSDPTNALNRMKLTLVKDFEYVTLGVLEILATDEKTVIDTFAIAIDPEEDIYVGGEKFECAINTSDALGDAVWLIGNSSNPVLPYDFNTIQVHKGNSGGYGGNKATTTKIYSNVMMLAAGRKTNPPNIAVGDGFISSHPDSQITFQESGVGKGKNYIEYRLNNKIAMQRVVLQLEGSLSWLMVVVDKTANSRTGQLSQAGLSKKEFRDSQVRSFVRNLRNISPAAEALWNDNLGFDYEFEMTRLLKSLPQGFDDGLNQGQSGNSNNRSYGGSISDIRLKTNITKIGKTEYGIPLYEWNYKDTLGLDHINRYRGVMAQDLLKTNMSKAVVLNSNGYYSVDYNQLSINLEKL